LGFAEANHSVCPSGHKWVKGMWYIYTKKYSSIRKNEILPFVAAWRDLEDI
jgi:hypothetical protein